MVYLYKAYFGNIFCEVGIAENPRATILLCPGLPGIPKEQALLKRLLLDGFNVLYPRYCGTFESNGLFLEQSPTEDLMDLLGAIEKPFTELYGLTKKELKLGRLIIFGASFGASVGLDILSRMPAKGIFIAPVIDFQKQGSHEGEQTTDTIQGFIERANRHTYRVANGGFALLAVNQLISPLANKNYSTKQVLLLHGADDRTVSIHQSEELARKSGLRLRKIPGGHITFSDLPYEELQTLLDSLLRS